MNATQLLSSIDDLETLHARLHDHSIGPGWAKPTPSLYPEPYKNFEPFLWRWEDGRAALDSAGRLISTDHAERRNLILYNPVKGNDYATVRTLIAAYQMILPGEKARSHRHTPNALRFIIEGEGSYTIVNGERLDMHPNDVLLTPNWDWHGHASEADGPCYWMDCLDVPLVHFLEPMFFEQYPEVYEPIEKTSVQSPFIFPWKDIQEQLDGTAPDPDGRYGRRIELGNPALNSIALHMNRLEGGIQTRTTRTTANQILCVADGSGSSEIEGHKLSWQRGDVFAIPSWRPFFHKSDGSATLFEMSDTPVMQALGWLRLSD